MATIITRETTAPGVTNNQAPLTNSQLDQNFINLNTDKLEKDNAPYLDFNTTAGETILEGKLAWDDGDGTLAIGLKGGVSLKVGQEQVQRVLNNTGSTLTKGQAVYITGAQGQRLTVALAQANQENTSSRSFAVVTEDILNGSEGFVASEGLVRNISTTGIGEGSALYLSPTTPGALTVTKPTAPDHIVLVGFCVRQHATNGSIFVKVQNGFELEELHNVSLSSLVNGQVLAYESSTGLWKNTASPVINYLPISGGTLTGDLQLNANLLRFNQVGTRSWSIASTGGNLDIVSGDAQGLLRYNTNTVVHSGNYNTYSPTLTGGGASGTWNISISGNAATVTNGITTTNYSSYALPLTGGTLTGLVTTRSTTGAMGVDTQGTPGIEVYATSGAGNAAYMTFHRPGSYGVRFGLDTDNVLKVGGWSIGNTAHAIFHAGNYTSYLNNTYLRGTGTSAPYQSWNTTGNVQNTLYQIGQENFNVGATGNSDFPSSRSYSYGILANLSSNSSARAQIYISHAGNDLIFRGGWGDSSWQTWNKVLTDQNYNSYSPTLTGTGASGTWSINITGNAATVTNGVYTTSNVMLLRAGVTDSTYNSATTTGLYTVSYTGYSRSLMVWNTGGSTGIVQLDVNYGDTGEIRLRNATDSATWSNWRTFLTDYNYTSYTLPRSGSWYGSGLPGTRWGGFTANGGEISFGQDLPNTGQMGILVDGCYIAGENNGFWSLASDNTWGSRRGMYWDGSYLNFTTNTPTGRFQNLYIDGGITTVGSITVSSGNATGGGIVLADDGDIVDLNDGYGSMRFSNGVRVFSANRGGSAVHTLHSDGNAYFNTSARSPIFYDNNDTGYYCDPNSTSRLVTLNVIGDITVGVGQTSSNIYFADSDEGTRRMHCNSNRIGFLSDGNAWGSYCGDGGEWYSDQSVRSPIFYDSDDTGYYCNPNSTSNLYGLTVAATISGSVSGSAGSVPWSGVTGKPTIPTATSQLSNDSGYITASGVSTAVGGIGTYMFGTDNANTITARQAGYTTSAILPTGAGAWSWGQTAYSGTWKCMGATSTYSQEDFATLWVRIA